MKQTKKIVITGSISTGKSTVTDLIRNAGYTVIDSDKISFDVTKKDSVGLKKIVDEFGEKFLVESGELNRKKLGNLIFKDYIQRNKLNSILHPLILNEVKNQIQISKEKIIFVDIPLYFEIKKEIDSFGLFFDEIVLVYSNRDIQLSRLMNRDNIDKIAAKSKINSQISIEEKKSLSTYVIYNNGTLEELKEEVSIYLKSLRGYK